MFEKLLEWDRDSLIYLNSLGIEEYDLFWLTVTKFPTWIPLFLLIIFLLFWKNSRKEGFWMLLSYVSMLMLLSATIFLTKEYVGRLRPNNDETINLLIRIVHQSSNYSFFSGHAASSFSIATITVLFLRKKILLIHVVWIYPILFSFSRIYVGVHYPTDIIVGAFIGMFFAWLFYRMNQKFIAPYLM
ncbi:MAG: phosphatase PAP2 family protein [Maribacter sp.]